MGKFIKIFVVIFFVTSITKAEKTSSDLSDLIFEEINNSSSYDSLEPDSSKTILIEPYKTNTKGCENFDDLTVGGYVAGQLGGLWTTWSGLPGTQDAVVSDNYSNSPNNSFHINDAAIDLVYQFDEEPITSGYWGYSHYMYIPSGYSGYFNVQAHPVPGVGWVVEVFFNENGTGYIDSGNETDFNYNQDEWIYVIINFDLYSGYVEIYLNGYLIHTITYLASSIGGINYYGLTSGGNPGAYYDDVCSYNGPIVPPPPIIPPPTNLEATVIEDDVQLNWDPPSSSNKLINSDSTYYNCTGVELPDVSKKYEPTATKEFLGYNIYRNGSNVAYTTATSWLDEDPTAGTYDYYVTALYSIFILEESQPSNYETITIEAELFPPLNLSGPDVIEIGELIELIWDEPVLPVIPNLIELSQHDGVVWSGYMQQYEQGYGVVFDLSNYPGCTIEMIDFRHASYGVIGLWDYKIHIVNWTDYSEIAVVGPIQTTINDNWEMEVDLGSFTSDSSLVGIFIEPLSYDPDEAYPRLALDFPLNGSSFLGPLSNYSAMESAYGDFLLDLWIIPAGEKQLIKAKKILTQSTSSANTRKDYIPFTRIVQIVKQSENSYKDFQSYFIYRSINYDPFELIYSTADTNYTDNSTSLGIYEYYITAVYDEGESDSTNHHVVDVISGIQGNILDSTYVYPNPATDFVNIKSNNTIETITVYSFTGQVIHSEFVNKTACRVNAAGFEPGLYLFVIETDERRIVKRIVIQDH